MGKTRDFLAYLNGTMFEYDYIRRQLISEFGRNPHLEHYYRNQIMVHDQKYIKQFKTMIDQHIAYLSEKDSYGRSPLPGAEAKKILFETLRDELLNIEDKTFMEALSQKIETLENNPIIDQPRWPALQVNNIFHLFKSFFQSKYEALPDQDKETKNTRKLK